MGAQPLTAIQSCEWESAWMAQKAYDLSKWLLHGLIDFSALRILGLFVKPLVTPFLVANHGLFTTSTGTRG